MCRPVPSASHYPVPERAGRSRARRPVPSAPAGPERLALPGPRARRPVASAPAGPRDRRTGRRRKHTARAPCRSPVPAANPPCQTTNDGRARARRRRAQGGLARRRCCPAEAQAVVTRSGEAKRSTHPALAPSRSPRGWVDDGRSGGYARRANVLNSPIEPRRIGLAVRRPTAAAPRPPLRPATRPAAVRRPTAAAPRPPLRPATRPAAGRRPPTHGAAPRPSRRPAVRPARPPTPPRNGSEPRTEGRWLAKGGRRGLIRQGPTFLSYSGIAGIVPPKMGV